MQRLRRLRQNAALRELAAETRADVSKLIYPVFVGETTRTPQEVEGMPGVYRYPLGGLDAVVDAALDAGIGGLMLFGIPAQKDERGSGAYASDGVVPRAIREIRARIRARGGSLAVIADVCLCEYTSHGHCGLYEDGTVQNDRSLPLHARAAVAYARAGADMVAPSSMLDGVVGCIRAALDDAGFSALPIMAYSAKFASVFYTPFRAAADSAPQCGDRRGYQMDARNGREALRELEADEREGADVLMVKPALAYLDVLAAARAQTRLPVAAYNVSGEYAMVKAAAAAGVLDERRTVEELMQAFFRAGADMVISYHALDYAQWRKE